ncbi:MAG: DUF1127 domain-containing protein [Rhodobacteraceae bacterium]|nr:DUF1127 domain-containing protein [Paracoccaceae bacterium]
MERTLALRHAATRSLRSVVAFLLARRNLARQRARLMVLDDHLLRDIGLTRHEALSEARRPAWDAPDHWHG